MPKDAFKRVFLQPKKERYESGKIQGAALPEKERAGQDRQSPIMGRYHPQPHDGAVQLQSLLPPQGYGTRVKPAERQEPGSGGGQ